MMRVLAVVPHTRSWMPAWGRILAATAGVDTVFLRTGDRGDVPYYVNVETKLRTAKALALAGGYDAAWFIDDDNVIPVDSLARLSALVGQGADVAYGLNCWRNWPHYWSATLARTESTIDVLNMHQGRAQSVFGQVVEVLGIGFYNTLVTRRALEATPLERRGEYANDCYAADDWRAAGLVSLCDTSLTSGHMIDLQRVVWPAIDGGPEGWWYRMEAVNNGVL